MMNTRWGLPLAALLCAACAGTTPAPATAPAAPPTQSSVPSPQSSDRNEFRQHLEEAYSAILSRETRPAAPSAIAALPAVDVEAAASMPIPEHRTINNAVNLFSGSMRRDIQTYLHRSARYRKLIDKALAEQRLPKGLAYLPVIESGYAPTLTSRAGAHGIWQFMPETAREYGMRVDWWVDERADPERSTRAAARYLKDLYRQFKDWPLALAAYNCGPGRVRRVLRETGATTFWELLEMSALPKETRGYVPTFYATLIIASDPETYGFTLRPPQDWDERRVEIEGPVSLRLIAEVADLDEAVLKDMNPALHRGFLPPGRFAIRVPHKSVERIAARADSLREDDDYIKVTSFTLRSGDSLTRLARALGVSAETLREMNGLGADARVRPGDALYLPVRARELGTLLTHADDKDIYYAVRKGDTLYSIAKKNGLTVEELRELNELGENVKLKLGMKLRVSPPRALTAGGM